MGDQLSASQAARMAGCSHSTIRRWLSEGVIPQAKKEKKGWVIDADSFRQFLIAEIKPRSTIDQQPKENVDLDHLRLLTEQLKKSESRCEILESENRKLNAEIRAILSEKAASKNSVKGVLSRWIRV